MRLQNGSAARIRRLKPGGQEQRTCRHTGAIPAPPHPVGVPRNDSRQNPAPEYRNERPRFQSGSNGCTKCPAPPRARAENRSASLVQDLELERAGEFAARSCFWNSAAVVVKFELVIDVLF